MKQVQSQIKTSTEPNKKVQSQNKYKAKIKQLNKAEIKQVQNQNLTN